MLLANHIFPALEHTRTNAAGLFKKRVTMKIISSDLLFSDVYFEYRVMNRGCYECIPV